MRTPDGWRRLGRSDYATDPVTLAQALIGCRLVHRTARGRRVSGVIIETEAYLGVRDAAAHSYRGRRTKRVEPMYGAPGTAYVYFTYGMHHCMNVVCGGVDEPVAALIRALAPEEGVGLMRQRRWGGGRGGTRKDARLCAGPGMLCEALGIDLRLSGADLCAHPRLFLEAPRAGFMKRRGLTNTPRIGVGYAGAWARRRLRWVVGPTLGAGRPGS